LTRNTIEGLLVVAQKRIQEQYKFYASLLGAELTDDEMGVETQDPKKLLAQIKDFGVDFEIKDGK